MESVEYVPGLDLNYFMARKRLSRMWRLAKLGVPERIINVERSLFTQQIENFLREVDLELKRGWEGGE